MPTFKQILHQFYYLLGVTFIYMHPHLLIKHEHEQLLSLGGLLFSIMLCSNLHQRFIYLTIVAQIGAVHIYNNKEFTWYKIVFY